MIKSIMVLLHLGLSRWLSVKESTCQWRRRFDLPRRLGEILWDSKWQPTPVFLPGKFHGQRSLVGYCPWGRKRAGHDWVTEHSTPLHRRICLVFNSNYVVWYLQNVRGYSKRAPQAKNSVGGPVNCVSLVVSWCTWAFWKTRKRNQDPIWLLK